jgi:hypothetical protein
VRVASVFASLVEIFASSFSADGNEDSWAALALLRAEVGTRCWIMVLLTAYLNDGELPAGEDSEIKERRMEFCEEARGQNGMTVTAQDESEHTMIEVFQDSVLECS